MFNLVSPAAVVDPEALDCKALFNAADTRGYLGKPLKKKATALERQAWIVGDVRRRAEAGQVLSSLGAGSRCVKCKAVNWGIRAGCSCWPHGGWDEALNKAGGFAMEYGALIAAKGRDAGFLTIAELKESIAKGVPLIDYSTGVAVELPD